MAKAAQGKRASHPRAADYLKQFSKDFLLIYRVDDTAGKPESIVFVRAGSHSDLFNE